MTTNTEYKGFPIRQTFEGGRFFATNANWSMNPEFRVDGYPTLNHAKGAITNYLKAKHAAHDKGMEILAAKLAEQDAENEAMPAATPAPEHSVTGVVSASRSEIRWTSKRNDKGAPIAANPKTANVYAELDYYGMTKTRDTRSRNQREGRYAGKIGRHQRAQVVR